MAPRHRERLPKLLEHHGGDFGLNMRSLLVEGFELRYKSDVRLSASDVVMVVTMMLGRPRVDKEEAKMRFQCVRGREGGVAGRQAGRVRASGRHRQGRQGGRQGGTTRTSR